MNPNLNPNMNPNLNPNLQKPNSLRQSRKDDIPAVVVREEVTID
jgi:hypothetical protein